MSIGARLVLGEEFQDDHNLVVGFDPRLLSATADLVVKDAYRNIVPTAAVSICHVALVAFIEKPGLFRYRNQGFMRNCYNLSFIIVVKWSI